MLNVQANWFIEWHLDVLTLWALAKAGEISKAEDLLKGLRERWKCYILHKIFDIQYDMNYNGMFSYCRVLGMTKKKQQLMQRAMRVCSSCYFYGYMKIY